MGFVAAMLEFGSAQVRYDPLQEADESAMGSYTGGLLPKQALEASYFKTFDIYHKFSDAPASDWQPRSHLVIGYDSQENIANAAIETPFEAQDLFTPVCDRSDGTLYQLKIP